MDFDDSDDGRLGVGRCSQPELEIGDGWISMDDVFDDDWIGDSKFDYDWVMISMSRMIDWAWETRTRLR